ncbi:MAG: DmsC/YnfH family molybdoenzyme membrane anchor subunit [Candidatus Omnitrophota bacterium]|nr:DmsC/YnfH family molybdoenzyme membrane anchor subunit [Candidatus Omnitrophota bacterium]
MNVSTQEFNLIDLLDEGALPLKNRIDTGGFYAPREAQPKGNASSLIPEEPLKEGEQYRFHFNMASCVGCNCCVVACNEQNGNPADVNWRRVGEIEGGIYPETKRFHISMACNHCLDPSCLTGCPTDAYIKLDDGIVQHQAEECIGCGYCTWNCPYGVPQYNPERNIVTKCDMCHGRLKDGEMPACVAACPESAIRIEKVDVKEWRENHLQADAPFVPDSGMTLSTTRITLPADVPIDMMKGNRHRIEPERPHTSLIVLTTLTQLAMGGFFTLWLGDLLSKFVSHFNPMKSFMPFGAAGMLVVTGVALLAAVFHLGRPLHAYKALRMWRRSWLSREVLLFAVFSHVGALYAALQLAVYYWSWPIPEVILFFLGGLVVLSGFAGVYASAKIYLVPARPAWNTIRTPLRFFLTGFITGPLFSLVVYAFYVRTQTPDYVKMYFQAPAVTFLLISIAAGAAQLVVLLSRLFHLRESISDELYGASFLLIHRFKHLFLTRLALLVLGAFLFPFLLIYELGLGGVSHTGFIGLSVTSFMLAFLGEWIGRYLFFVTVVPKNMPGSFFTKNGGGH